MTRNQLSLNISAACRAQLEDLKARGISHTKAVEQGVALVHDALGARLAREHNDANVICFGGRMIGSEVARDCLRIFLEAEFQGGRHAPRVEKLSNPREPAR